MRLIELEATFVGRFNPADGSYFELPSVDGAQGVLFVCPKCQNHSVLCWFTNPQNAPVVPVDALPGPGRWQVIGDSIESLSLHPSVDLSVPPTAGCRWHGWVKSGAAD